VSALTPSRAFERGVNACIDWLRLRALEMNDPRARLVLNSASFSLGANKPTFASAPSSPWQPIETAPKDGSWVLGWIVHPGDDFCPEPFARAAMMCWTERERVPFEPDRWKEAHWHQQWIGEPTYWLPIPAAPAAAKPDTTINEDSSADATRVMNTTTTPD
jgi:hypothetical protein